MPTGEPNGIDMLAEIEQLDGNFAPDREKLVSLLGYVAVHGPMGLPDTICHKVEEFWQLTAKRIRVLWFYDEGRIVVCAHWFKKKTQKTKASDIEAARRVKRRYEKAKADGRLNHE